MTVVFRDWRQLVTATGGTAARTLGDHLALVQDDDSAPSNDAAWFTQTGASEDNKAKRIFRGDRPGDHIGNAWSEIHIEYRPVGSGLDGPSQTDAGLSVSGIKQNFSTPDSATMGEIDCVYVVARNTGPEATGAADGSDTGGFVADVAQRGNTGFLAVLEGVATNLDRTTGDTNVAVRAQIAAMSSLTGGITSYGAALLADAGEATYGLYLKENSGTFEHFITCEAQGGDKKFEVTADTLYAANIPTTTMGVPTNGLWVDDRVVKRAVGPTALGTADNDGSETDLAEYTFSGLSIGTVAADRYVAVAIMGRKAAPSSTVSAVTVGGVSATFVVRSTNNGSTVEIWIAAVPTGTSADVVVTWADTMNRCAVVTQPITALNSPIANNTASSAAAPAVLAADVSVAGAAIAMAFTDSGAATFVWSGLTKRVETSAVVGQTYSFANGAFADGEMDDFTATPTNGGSNPVAVAASFR